MTAPMAAVAQGSTTLASHQARFEALLATHRGIVFKIAHAYARTPQDRQDLAQDIVAHAWRAFPYYDEVRRFSTWMYRIALNVAISARRSAGYRERTMVPADPVDLAAVADPAAGEPDARVRELHRVIERLGDYDRALVVLYLEGHDHKTIGEILGISDANVATKLSRIRQRLRTETEHGTR